MPPDAASPHSILLVDVNPHGLVARKQLLTDLGYRIETVESAEEALRLIESEQQFFHLVVTDFKLDGLNGVDLISRLRQISPKTRTILLSGLVSHLGLTEVSTGADAVISKCANEVAQLTRSVKALLARRMARKPPLSQKRAAPITMVKSV